MLPSVGQRQHVTEDPGHAVDFLFFKRQQFQDACFLGHASSDVLHEYFERGHPESLKKYSKHHGALFPQEKKIVHPPMSFVLRTAQCVTIAGFSRVRL